MQWTREDCDTIVIYLTHHSFYGQLQSANENIGLDIIQTSPAEMREKTWLRRAADLACRPIEADRPQEARVGLIYTKDILDLH